MEYKIAPIHSTRALCSFDCGLQGMNTFLRGALQDSIDNHYCRCFTLTPINDATEVIAVFALSFDSLMLDSDDKEDLMTGFSDTPIPDVSLRYEDIFLSKRCYPALEITYLAVDVKYQRSHIGTHIIDHIANIARTQQIAGCQFLTVEALKTEPHSAVTFYRKCDFTPNEIPNPNKDTLRMYRTLYVAEE